MVLKSPLPDIALPQISFNELILSSLKNDGDAIALVDADDNGRTYTFSEVHDCIVKCARSLYKLGIRRGGIVAVTLGNRPEFIFAVVATAACGAILTTCNPNYTEDEIVKQFSHSEPQVVIVENSGYEKMKAVSQRVSSIQSIFTAERHQSCTCLRDLMQDPDQIDYPWHVRPDLQDDPFFLPYSSGTTGLPKGVMLTHANMTASTRFLQTLNRWSRQDVLLLVLPLFHIYGTTMVFSSLLSGTKVVLQRRFNIESFLRCVQDYKVSIISAVPPMILAVYNSPLFAKYDTSSLRRILSGAAPLPESVGADVRKRLKTHVCQGWGMTEAVGCLTWPVFDDIPLKSVGIVAPNTLLKESAAYDASYRAILIGSQIGLGIKRSIAIKQIVDPLTGRELGVGEEGEICCKGPQVMKGYYKNPEETARTVDVNGWLHTGDVGHYDEIGQVYVIDRLKELIKVKGFQVAPAELEEILLSHPSVSDVAVIGVPDPESGEVPKAYIVLNDQSTSSSDLHKFLQGRVSSYKRLRGGITFCEVIPKSASGKILRKELRALEAKNSKL